MDHGDQPDDILEGFGTEGTLAEEVPDMAVYQARYHRAVQADHLRYGVVLHIAAVYDVHVYRGFRSHRRYPNGRCTATGVLLERYLPLGVFFDLPNGDCRHVPDQCRLVRKGLFPAFGFAGIEDHLQTIPFLPAVDHVHFRLCAVCHQGGEFASECVSALVSGIGADDPMLGIGLGADHFLAHHQVP